jgi:hypothetical protein
MLPERLRAAFLRTLKGVPEVMRDQQADLRGIARRGDDPGLLRLPTTLSREGVPASQLRRADEIVPLKCRPGRCSGSSSVRGFRFLQLPEARRALSDGTWTIELDGLIAEPHPEKSNLYYYTRTKELMVLGVLSGY